MWYRLGLAFGVAEKEDHREDHICCFGDNVRMYDLSVRKVCFYGVGFPDLLRIRRIVMLHIIVVGIVCIASAVSFVLNERVKGKTGGEIAAELVILLIIGGVLLLLLGCIVFGWLKSCDDCVVGVGKMG